MWSCDIFLCRFERLCLVLLRNLTLFVEDRRKICVCILMSALTLRGMAKISFDTKHSTINIDSHVISVPVCITEF